MKKYPLGRWFVGSSSMGASVHTKEIPEGKGSGYYLYGWKRGAAQIIVDELLESTTKEERQNGAHAAYATLDTIPVPEELHRWDEHQQELAVARLIHTDMIERFGTIAEWIMYGNDGCPVWFHDEVVRENSDGR